MLPPTPPEANLRQRKGSRTSEIRGMVEGLVRDQGAKDEVGLMQLPSWATKHQFPDFMYIPNVFLPPAILFPQKFFSISLY